LAWWNLTWGGPPEKGFWGNRAQGEKTFFWGNLWLGVKKTLLGRKPRGKGEKDLKIPPFQG